MIKKISRNRNPITINLVCNVVFALLCFAPIIHGYSESLCVLTHGRILIVPLLATIVTVFDGFPFVRFKYVIVLSVTGFPLLSVIYVMIKFETSDIYDVTLWFYMLLGCHVVWLVLPFFVRRCDRTGLVPVNITDLIWISCIIVVWIAMTLLSLSSL